VGNDPSIAGLIVAQDTNLRLIGRKALELTELLSLDLDVGDDGVRFAVPRTGIVNDFRISHVLRGLIFGAPD
jgi:hypothetical protein